jgi:hypothetical protein
MKRIYESRSFRVGDLATWVKTDHFTLQEQADLQAKQERYGNGPFRVVTITNEIGKDSRLTLCSPAVSYGHTVSISAKWLRPQ